MQTIRLFSSPPNMSDSFSYGWDTMKRDFLRLFLIVIVCGIALLPTGLANDEGGMRSAGFVLLNLIGVAYFFLVFPVFSYGAKYLFLQSVRKEEVDIRTIIRGFDNYLNIVLANLLSTALIGIAFVALVIPGIIVACRLVFVPYLVMDKNLDPVAAVEESWRMTRGMGWTVFGLGFVSIFIAILGLICLGVGIIPAVIWIYASFGSLYQATLEHRADGNGEENEGVPGVEEGQ